MKHQRPFSGLLSQDEMHSLVGCVGSAARKEVLVNEYTGKVHV